MHFPLALVLAVLGAELTHPELKLALDLPDGWRLDAGCGPFVPPEPRCRTGGKPGPCPATLCPERVGVLWLTAPAVLTTLEAEKAELLESDAGVYVTSQPLPDGWVLTWGGLQWSDVFPFKVSRKIGGRTVECSGEATSLAGLKELVDACKSVRAAKPQRPG